MVLNCLHMLFDSFRIKAGVEHGSFRQPGEFPAQKIRRLPTHDPSALGRKAYSQSGLHLLGVYLHGSPLQNLLAAGIHLDSEVFVLLPAYLPEKGPGEVILQGGFADAVFKELFRESRPFLAYAQPDFARRGEGIALHVVDKQRASPEVVAAADILVRAVSLAVYPG